MTTNVMEWRICPRFPHYEISECGDLRDVGKIYNPEKARLRGFIDSDGYLRYSISNSDGAGLVIQAHRLVAEAFIGPAPSDKHEVAHNNGSRISCFYKNLRWSTRKENAEDTRIHDTNPAGSRNNHAKITEEDVHYIRREYRRVKTLQIKGGLAALDAKFDLHRSTIIGIAKFKSWKHVPVIGDYYDFNEQK